MGISTVQSNRSKSRKQWRSRQWRRKYCVFVLLFLAGVFSFRSWKASTMITCIPHAFCITGDSKPDGRSDDERQHCEWELNGPLLYRLQPTKKRSAASHWDQVMECFVGRRVELKKHFPLTHGADVYIQDTDNSWNSRLTPMTRLLIAAGLSSSGVRAVHFIEDHQATFSYPSTQERIRSETKAGGGVRGRKEDPFSRPLEGQIGVLRLDRRSEFMVTSAEEGQSLDDVNRLSIAAPVVYEANGRRDNSNGRGGGGVLARRGEGTGGTGSRGGKYGATTAAAGEECVKFVTDVGSLGQEDQRKWFPEDRDARELLLALDNFCPISWLRREKAETDDGDEDMVGEMAWREVDRGVIWAGEAPGVYRRRNPGALISNRKDDKRKVIIYQRDRDRKLLKSKEVADELHDRLALLGWSVEEVVHDDLRPPCGLINQLAGADVLLTPHGFQSILSLFLRPGSILFEVYPHKYFREAYGPVVSKFGVRYGFSESAPQLPLTGFAQPTAETCMRWALCRWYVARSNVEMTEDGLEILISLMLDGEGAR